MNNIDVLLNKDILKDNLIASSLYLCSYELLKNRIVDGIKSFFTNGFLDGKDIISKEYNQDVLSLNPSPIKASLMWLKKMGAISEEDIIKCISLKDQRDEIAHNLINLLESQNVTQIYSYLKNVLDILEKVERWWIYNVDISIDPQFDNKEINPEDIIVASVEILKHMVYLANDIKHD